VAGLVGRRPAASRRVLGVAEVVAGLRGLLEEEIGRLFVAGEIGDLHRARSGHLYFVLKDDTARLRAALFRGDASRLPFEPEEGLEVIAFGSLSVYPARGDLQLIVRRLEPLGQGALQLAVEQLRARLEAEGLFDPARKRTPPAFPRRIGVVTSPVGAALRDVLQVSGHRFPGVPLVLAPTRVQGEGAEHEIVAALEAVQRVPGVDVVLVVRGGGSFEDLLAFQTETVARAIAACRVPVVCGVGHEVDVTLADLAADLRAPTPSAAAALALPDREALLAQLGRDRRRLVAAARGRLDRARLALGRDLRGLRAHAPRARLGWQRARLERARRGLARAWTRRAALGASRLGALDRRLARGPEGLLETRRSRLAGAGASLVPCARRAVGEGRGRLATAAAALEALSPLAVLARGYAIAQREDGAIVRRAAEVAPGERLTLRLHQGRLSARVEAVHEDAGAEPRQAAKPPDSKPERPPQV
jgi:exodeoxyribonuclease VII large subunit